MPRGASVFSDDLHRFVGDRALGSGGVDARAWINIGGFSFQTSEAVKIAFILTFAKHLDSLRKRGWIDRPLHVVLLAVHALVPMGLCEIQGDTGAAIVFFAMFVVMSLAAGVKLRYFAILGGLVLLALPLLWQFVMEDYPEARFPCCLNLDYLVCRCMMGTSSTKGAFPLEAESSLVRGCSTAAGWRTGLSPSNKATISSLWRERNWGL